MYCVGVQGLRRRAVVVTAFLLRCMCHVVGHGDDEGAVITSFMALPAQSWLDEEELAFVGGGEELGGVGAAQEDVDAGAQVGGFDGLALGI